MKSLIDLKKELKEGKVNNLYVFTGEENLIRKIYYKKISELYGNIKYLESVQDLYKELEKKSLFQLKMVYIVYNDLDYLKQKEKVYERLIELSRKHCVVLVYDEIPDKSVFKKVFDDYITIFNYVTSDVAIKYVNKESHKVDLQFAKKIAFNCFNSYNNIVEEMNKYKHFIGYNREVAEINQEQFHDDAIDAMTYACLFTDREEIPTAKEFADAFITRDSNLLSRYLNIIKKNECNILGYIPELYNTVNIFIYLKIYGKWDGGTKAYNAGEYWGRIKEIRDYRVPYTKNDLLDIRWALDKLDKDIRSGRMPAQFAWDWLIGVIL